MEDPQGQIIYADAGGDPRDAQPFLGNLTTMLDAVGPDASAVRPPRAKSAKGAKGVAGADPDVDIDPDVGVAGVSGKRTGGAGFYWRTISVLYYRDPFRRFVLLHAHSRRFRDLLRAVGDYR